MSSILYEIKTSKKRKTVAIKIQKNQVTVYAPTYVSKHYLDELVQSKSTWISEQLHKQQALIKPSIFMRQNMCLFGQEYPIRFSVSKQSRCFLLFNTIEVETAARVKTIEPFRIKQIQQFLAEQLQLYLAQRLAFYCQQMNLDYQGLKIQHYRRRWGSCSSKGVISFNLLLAQTPHWVIDYVIVHELAHLKHLNHSALFWQLVETHYPDRKKAENWLKNRMFDLEVE
ncbi:SprT family zinc-dependent metalloprotease [Pseudoalteromonas tunicata]|uniref:M48 family metallopeptidase n=1 Tax=Pseudoalteromonas tunicata TaxID=314281 RepID=UPI00273E5125|nr:SprT family zinc-dependent metalloprotease [Pseudoalteromonas tunicata]MDP5211599.1 SprT family zinc-dependent metalloprotease [Pseudoalteromonas tunicata]